MARSITVWPELLPGGQAVLFTITATTGDLDQAQVAVFDLRTATQTTLIRGGSDAHFVRSGHLVYGAAGTLRTVALDVARLTVVGAPVTVIPQVGTTISGATDVAMASDGTLVYVPSAVVAGGAGGVQNTLVWVDRQGQEAAISHSPAGTVTCDLHPTALARRSPSTTSSRTSGYWTWCAARSRV